MIQSIIELTKLTYSDPVIIDCVNLLIQHQEIHQHGLFDVNKNMEKLHFSVPIGDMHNSVSINRISFLKNMNIHQKPDLYAKFAEYFNNIKTEPINDDSNIIPFTENNDVNNMLLVIYYNIILPLFIYCNESSIMHLYIITMNLKKKMSPDAYNSLINKSILLQHLCNLDSAINNAIDHLSHIQMKDYLFSNKLCVKIYHNNIKYVYRIIYIDDDLINSFNVGNIMTTPKVESWSLSFSGAYIATNQYKQNSNTNMIVFISQYTSDFCPVMFVGTCIGEYEVLLKSNTSYKIISKLNDMPNSIDITDNQKENEIVKYMELHTEEIHSIYFVELL